MTRTIAGAEHETTKCILEIARCGASEAMNTAAPHRYHLAARWLHWIMAAGFVFMWLCGYTMTTLVAEDSALEEVLFDLHISTGVTLLALLAVRIAIRMFTTPPPLPPGISHLDRTGARLGHAALYALPAIVMAVGWMEVDLEGHTVTWFGTSLPKVFPTVESWRGLEPGQLAATVHQWLAYTLLGIALVHVAAVVKHRFFDGHDILGRMTLTRRR